MSEDRGDNSETILEAEPSWSLCNPLFFFFFIEASKNHTHWWTFSVSKVMSALYNVIDDKEYQPECIETGLV